MADHTVATQGNELSGRISSWRDFADRVGAAMAMAAASPTDITLMDIDFVHWPIGQRSVMEAFHQWGLISRGPHCQVIAHSYDAFARRHPRWVAWRGTWAHRVSCYQVSDEWVSSLQPTLLLHGTLGLRLHEPLHGVGVWTRDDAALKSWMTEIDVILQRSHEALPPTTLGL
ncbi:MAG: hypothetical protein QM749_19535 [Aquabacterium sp.]